MKKFTLFFVILFCLFSCNKSGPAGPQGNANVQTVLFKNITVQGYYNFEISAITQSIIDSGVVIGSCKPSSATDWSPMPLVDPINNMVYEITSLYPGQATVINEGYPLIPFDFKFDIIAANQ